ncbi:BrnT family toxin [Caballeronia sp. KNU42]
MGISYNAQKSEANIQERGLSFEAARDFVMSSALIVEDCRNIYLERRFQALGFIADRLHMLVFTPRGDKIHVISLRKANLREVKRYEQAEHGRNAGREPRMG